MGHCISGIIALHKSIIDAKLLASDWAVATLPQGYAMLVQESGPPPYQTAGIEFLHELATNGQVLLEHISHISPAAWVETEYFGGMGTQSAAVWSKGQIIFGPLLAPNAINTALQLLGVTREKKFDEFDTLSLGNHRNNDDWFASGIPAS